MHETGVGDHILASQPPVQGASVLLFCGKFKGHVERAERDRASQDKDNGEDAEDYGCSAGEYLGADQQSDDDGCRQADDSIDASHIFQIGRAHV